MRVCEKGLESEDPCNVKNDTGGCVKTMGVKFREGFSYVDLLNGTTGPTGPPTATTTVTSTTTFLAPLPTTSQSSAMTFGSGIVSAVLLLLDQF
jgi:hypothetical protein